MPRLAEAVGQRLQEPEHHAALIRVRARYAGASTVHRPACLRNRLLPDRVNSAPGHEPRIFAFWAWNSASVRMPWDFNSASSFSWVTVSLYYSRGFSG